MFELSCPPWLPLPCGIRVGEGEEEGGDGELEDTLDTDDCDSRPWLLPRILKNDQF